MSNKLSIFLDSGAFSAWSQGVTIDIDEYIAFIKEHQHYLDVYAVLDSIGDPEATLRNQDYMESKGLSPLPCFHYGEDIKYLNEYLSRGYDYIALGGMVPIGTAELMTWLDGLFSHSLCDGKGNPTIKVHGFGLTSLPLLLRYPWYSVDSTSWVMIGRFGSVFVPRKRAGKYIYDEQAHKVVVSEKSDVGDGKHLCNYSKMERDVILAYFAEHGFTEKQLGEDYMARDRLNIQYFLDLEKNLPAWPWAFKLSNQSKGLGLRG